MVKNLILLYISRAIGSQGDVSFGTADSEPIFPNMWFSGGSLQKGCGKKCYASAENLGFSEKTGTTFRGN